MNGTTLILGVRPMNQEQISGNRDAGYIDKKTVVLASNHGQMFGLISWDSNVPDGTIKNQNIWITPVPLSSLPDGYFDSADYQMYGMWTSRSSSVKLHQSSASETFPVRQIKGHEIGELRLEEAKAKTKTRQNEKVKGKKSEYMESGITFPLVSENTPHATRSSRLEF